jgi:hypothetical protein
MIYELRLPLINPHMSGATIESVHSGPAALKAGAKFLDVSIDLGSARVSPDFILSVRHA